MANLTDASKANKSGQNLEAALKKFLMSKDIPFKQQKPGKPEIDFIIGENLYVDCTNQNEEGSVDEKIPHKLWKYYKKYNYSEVYIIRGKKIPNDLVFEHCREICQKYNFKFHVVTLQEFFNFLEQRDFESPLEKFFIE